ncbi:unnamed protein product [Closterium sp. NIES-65]|nr:unnamed protein product [Closterium sp. NIES-65]
MKQMPCLPSNILLHPPTTLTLRNQTLFVLCPRQPPTTHHPLLFHLHRPSPAAPSFNCPFCNRPCANAGTLSRHVSACSRHSSARQQAARPPPPRPPPSAPPALSPPAIPEQTWEVVLTWDWSGFFSPTVLPGPLIRRIPSRIRLLMLNALLIPLHRLAACPGDTAAHLIILAFPRLVLRSPPSSSAVSTTSACVALLRRFLQGDWLSLFQEAFAAAVPATRPSTLTSARSTASQARINRAKRFARCGDFSRSLAALEAGELAPPSSDMVTALHAKHPPAAAEIPDWVASFTATELPQLTVPLLHQALRSAPRGTAAGPSGWLIEHLRDTFLSSQNHLPYLLRLFQSWLQGDLPPAVRSYYAASNLVALCKPQGGVRPIAIGEVLPRLLSRCVTLIYKQQIREFFLPSLQFGVAVPAGIEAMAHAVQAALSLHPNWVVLELDVANAFNSFNRNFMFDALRQSPFSSLIPFFRLFYAAPSPLHYRNGPILETLQSASGVRQGDPCGPFLYALTQQLAIHPTQQLHPSTFITSYADDTYIVGPAPDVFAAYNTLTSRLQPLGLTVQPSKCSLYGPSDIPPDAMPPPNLSIAPNGLTVAGVPIGSDSYIISSVGHKLRSFATSLSLLHDLHDPQIASRLLTLCVSARPSFLLRTVPPFPEITELYTDWDNDLLNHFTRLVGSEFWPPDFDHLPTAHHQPFLPIRIGGFGLRSSAGFADLGFLYSWAQPVPLLSSHFFVGGAPIFRPFISSDTIDRLDPCIVSAMSRLPPDILHLFPSWPALISGYPHKLYSYLSQLKEAAMLERVRSTVTSPLHLARITSLQGPHAGDWLSVAPSSQHLQLSPTEWKIAAAIRLGLPIPHLTTSRACRTITSFLVAVPTSAAETRVQELTWALDVTVADPQHGFPHSNAATVIGSAAAAREAEKRSLYATSLRDLPHVIFFPLAIETFGCFGKSFLHFLQDCSRRGAARIRDYSGTTDLVPHLLETNYFKRLSFVLQREQARSFPGFPYPGFPVSRYPGDLLSSFLPALLPPLLSAVLPPLAASLLSTVFPCCLPCCPPFLTVALLCLPFCQIPANSGRSGQQSFRAAVQLFWIAGQRLNPSSTPLPPPLPPAAAAATAASAATPSPIPTIIPPNPPSDPLVSHLLHCWAVPRRGKGATARRAREMVAWEQAVRSSLRRLLLLNHGCCTARYCSLPSCCSCSSCSALPSPVAASQPSSTGVSHTSHLLHTPQASHHHLHSTPFVPWDLLASLLNLAKQAASLPSTAAPSASTAAATTAAAIFESTQKSTHYTPSASTAAAPSASTAAAPSASTAAATTAAANAPTITSSPKPSASLSTSLHSPLALLVSLLLSELVPCRFSRSALSLLLLEDSPLPSSAAAAKSSGQQEQQQNREQQQQQEQEGQLSEEGSIRSLSTQQLQILSTCLRHMLTSSLPTNQQQQLNLTPRRTTLPSPSSSPSFLLSPLLPPPVLSKQQGSELQVWQQGKREQLGTGHLQQGGEEGEEERAEEQIRGGGRRWSQVQRVQEGLRRMQQELQQRLALSAMVTAALCHGEGRGNEAEGTGRIHAAGGGLTFESTQKSTHGEGRGNESERAGRIHAAEGGVTFELSQKSTHGEGRGNETERAGRSHAAEGGEAAGRGAATAPSTTEAGRNKAAEGEAAGREAAGGEAAAGANEAVRGCMERAAGNWCQWVLSQTTHTATTAAAAAAAAGGGDASSVGQDLQPQPRFPPFPMPPSVPSC